MATKRPYKNSGAGKGKGARNGGTLISLDKRTPEERRRIASMGGKAAAVKTKRNRDLKKLAQDFLNMDVAASQATIRKKMEALGLAEDDMFYANAILAAMIVRASNGDVNAAKFVRDTAGFNPEEKVNLNAEVSEKSDVLIYLPEIEKDEDEDADEETGGNADEDEEQ